MRSDLRSLLASIGNEIIPTGDQTDVASHSRLAAAAESLAVAHNQAVASAKDITAAYPRVGRGVITDSDIAWPLPPIIR